MTEKQNQNRPDTCRNRLMDYLARRDHSEKELREKLLRRFEPEDVETAIEYARENNWLADPVELAQRVADQLHRKAKGFLYINRYLQDKGLPSVEQNEDLEIEKARELVEKKFDQCHNLTFEDRKKAFKYLSYRGYQESVIKKVIYESR